MNVANGKSKVGLLYCVEVKACTYANQQLNNGLAKAAGARRSSTARRSR